MQLTGVVFQGERHIGVDEGDVIRLLGTADEFYSDVKVALAGRGVTVSAEGLERTPPVPETARVFCVGINYLSHGEESKDLAGLDVPKYPMIFGRYQQSLVTDGVAVPVPPNEDGLDWEVELAAVIGQGGWNIPEADALQHVLGYATFNDLSARKKQLQTPQFTIGKNADLSGPISPIVTADQVGDPADGLRVTTHVNGVLMQDGNTRDLIHSVQKIISYITDTLTLLPGDVIATGTPGGVGMGRKPPVLLQPGDVCTVEVEGVAKLTTPIIARGDQVDLGLMHGRKRVRI